MAKKVKLKTTQNTASVRAYLDSIEPASKRKDAKTLAKLFKETTQSKPKMWGTSIVGYGRYRYYRANGDEGEFMAAGFSIRKSGPVLYIMPGYSNYQDLLAKLGPHKLGKSCLYLKSLDGIDLQIISTLIKTSINDLGKKYEVTL